MKELLLCTVPILLAGLSFIGTLSYLKKYPQWLNFPLDFGLSFRGQRIFGANKTVRGPLFMGVYAALYGLIVFHGVEFLLGPFPPDISIADPLSSYFIVGLLYSLGELPNSFIKRQSRIPPGGVHFTKYGRLVFRFVDTFDSLIACGVGYYFLFRFSFVGVAFGVLLGGLLHLLTDQLMSKLELKRL